MPAHEVNITGLILSSNDFSDADSFFDILTNEMIQSSRSGNPFNDRNYLIARLDVLSRNEELQENEKNISQNFFDNKLFLFFVTIHPERFHSFP
mgnify:CR=1 FL=1